MKNWPSRGSKVVGIQHLTKAQFTGGPHRRKNQALLNEGQANPQRIEFAVVAVGVANVGDVAGGPGAH